MKYLPLLFLLFSVTAHAQKLFRYNQADTLVERITTPYFLSRKMIYFDSSYTSPKQGGGSAFKIGKVCHEIGCIGEFDATGKSQASWWLLENKIVICYMTPIDDHSFEPVLKVWRYDADKKKFILIL